MKINRHFLIGFSIGLVSFVLAIYALVLVLLPNLLNLNNYKARIFAQLEKDTGLKYSAEDIRLKNAWSPYLNLYAHHVKVLYPTEEKFLKITDANVKIRVMPLLFKKIVIEKVVLTRPIANIDLYSDSTTSIERYLRFKPSKSPYSAFSIAKDIPNIQLNRYKLKFNDVNLYSPFVFEGDSLVLNDIDLNKGFKLKTIGHLSSNKVDYINYDINLESYIPRKYDKKFFEVSPFFNIKKYSLHSDLYAHLKVREGKFVPNIDGDVNLTNLSIRYNGMVFSDNNINMDFKGDEVSINADVKTSLLDKATIAGTLKFGSHKFIDMTVKAVNVNLSNLHGLLVATLDSFSIPNPTRGYTVTGFADFDFKVKSNFKKLESSGIAKINGASVESKFTPFNINNINALINFSNNQIDIKEFVALVNRTPVKVKGKIDSNAFMNILVSSGSLELKNIIKEFALHSKMNGLSVNTGVLSFEANIKGKLDDLKIKINSNIKNLQASDSKTKAQVRISSVIANADIVKNKPKGKIILNNISLQSKLLKMPVSAKKISLNFDEKDLILNKSNLLIGASNIVVEGENKGFLVKPDLKINAYGKLNSNDLYKNLYAYKPFLASAKGSLPFVAKIESKAGNTKLHSQILANANNYVSALVIKELLNQTSIVNIEAELNPSRVKLIDLSLSKAGCNYLEKDDLKSNISDSSKILSLTGNISSLLNFSKMRFNDVKFIIPNSLTASISNINNSEISLKADITANGNILAPKVLGHLVINNFTVPDLGLSTNNVNINFDNQNSVVKIPYLKVGNSIFAMNANVSPKLGKTIEVRDIKINAAKLDLDDLISVFSPMFNTVSSPGISVPVNIKSGGVIVSKFAADGLNASNIKADLSMSNNLLKLKNVTGNAYNGAFWGNVEYNFLSTMTKLNLGGRGLDATGAALAVTGLEKVYGKLDFYSNVTMYGLNKRDRIHSLKGKSNVAIYNGQLGTLGRFEHFLYAQNLVSQSLMKASINLISQAVAPKNTGRMKYMKSQVLFSNGYANINSFTFSGPNMSMTMSGRINILNNWADLVILGKVSNEVASVLGPIGQLSLANIVSNISSSNQASLPNIFYNNYNQQVSQSVLDKIPDLTPKTQLKTKCFTVKIIGNIESVKSVKSFKWLVLNQPRSMTYQEPQVQQSVFTPNTTQAPHSMRTENSELPEFMKNLPD